MKKVLVSVCTIGLLAVLSSCSSSKNAAISTLGGYWDIIEVESAAIVPAAGQQFPFIVFDATTGRVHGNSGCNQMSGTFNKDAKAGTLDLSALVSTRMACLDMTTETKILKSLSAVKKFKQLSDATMALCDAHGKTVVVLKKKKMPRM
ncbi:MAG: META domain-containing protein [Prevotellaceae bacterium]|jgi:heat shock protein HslJ|nr:META domain-containing protein [Prevotellaceae bacterium]